MHRVFPDLARTCGYSGNRLPVIGLFRDHLCGPGWIPRQICRSGAVQLNRLVCWQVAPSCRTLHDLDSIGPQSLHGSLLCRVGGSAEPLGQVVW